MGWRILLFLLCFSSVDSLLAHERFGPPFDDFGFETELSGRQFSRIDEIKLDDVHSGSLHSEQTSQVNCRIGSYSLPCVESDGLSVFDHPIPVLPDAILAKFPSQYRRNGQQHFMPFIEEILFEAEKLDLSIPFLGHGFISYAWVKASTDETAGSIARFWNRVFRSWSAEEGLGPNGIYLTVRQNPSPIVDRTFQICHLYGFAGRPESPCVTVMIETHGEFYIRFAVSDYDGGYSFDPSIAMSCNINSVAGTTEDPVVKAFQVPPLDLQPYNFRTRQNRSTIRMKAELSPSSFFPGYFEIVDLSVDADTYDDIVYYEIDFDFLITKQNNPKIGDINHPKITQSAYYANKIIEIISRINGCEAPEIFLPSEFLKVLK